MTTKPKRPKARFRVGQVVTYWPNPYIKTAVPIVRRRFRPVVFANGSGCWQYQGHGKYGTWFNESQLRKLNAREKGD